MTSEQILTKAIQKAIDNGWLPHQAYVVFDVMYELGWIEFRDAELGIRHKSYDIASVIFNQDFAKALWGDLDQSLTEHPRNSHASAHLQNMVVADDPIRYLGEHL
jgi:hypothetical protein